MPPTDCSPYPLPTCVLLVTQSPVEKLLCVADACRSAVSALCTHVATQQLAANKAACVGSATSSDVDPCDVPVAVGSEDAVAQVLSAEVLVGALVQALVDGAGQGPSTGGIALCAALRCVRALRV